MARTLPLRADVLLSNTLFEDIDGGISVEFLRSYTGDDDLEATRSLELQVDAVSGNQRVECLGELLPNLSQLRLSQSNICTIRDLGTSLSNLKVLWLCRSSLQELDGIMALPILEELFVSFNDIRDLAPLCMHETLQVLDVEGNRIEDLGELEALQHMPKLRDLTLGSNPMCDLEAFSRERVLELLPQLEVLDDEPRHRPTSEPSLAVIDLTGEVSEADSVEGGLEPASPTPPSSGAENGSEEYLPSVDDLRGKGEEGRALAALRRRAGSKCSTPGQIAGEHKPDGASRDGGPTLTSPSSSKEEIGDVSEAVAELHVEFERLRTASGKGRAPRHAGFDGEPTEKDLVTEALRRARCRHVPRIPGSRYSGESSFSGGSRATTPCGFFPEQRRGGTGALRSAWSSGSVSTSYRPGTASSDTGSNWSVPSSVSTLLAPDGPLMPSSSDLTTGDEGATLAGNPLAAIRRRRKRTGVTHAEEDLDIRNLLRRHADEGCLLYSATEEPAHRPRSSANFRIGAPRVRTPAGIDVVRPKSRTGSGPVCRGSREDLPMPSFTTEVGEVLTVE